MITSVVTDDFDYLLFLLLKDNKQEEDTEVEENEQKGYFDENGLSDWFNKL